MEPIDYEYAVMREVHGKAIPWRGPMRGDQAWFPSEGNKTEEMIFARDWCDRWIAEAEAEGFRPGVFWTGRRPIVLDWEKC